MDLITPTESGLTVFPSGSGLGIDWHRPSADLLLIMSPMLTLAPNGLLESDNQSCGWIVGHSENGRLGLRGVNSTYR
jgi:hypothetical protein